MLRALFKLLWLHDSESAAILIIHLGEYLSPKDCREMGDYLLALKENKEMRCDRTNA